MPQEEDDIRCVGPPRLIAFKPEPRRTPHVEKVPSTYFYTAHSAWKWQWWPFSIFPTVIAARGGYNIRGGGVIVNLIFFLLHCRFQRLNLNRTCILLSVTTASSSVNPSYTPNCWGVKQTWRGWVWLVYLQQETELALYFYSTLIRYNMQFFILN